jgi:hypothetical protein
VGGKDFVSKDASVHSLTELMSEFKNIASFKAQWDMLLKPLCASIVGDMAKAS